MLPIKKIYIDSRNRTADSIDASNFKIQLPYTIEIPDNTVFFVTDVCIPHVYQLIETGLNDRLYFKYFARKKTGGDNLPYSFWSSVVLPAGGYNGNITSGGSVLSGGQYLAQQIQAAMNGGVNPNANITFSASWDSNLYQISISCSGTDTSLLLCSPKNIINENDFQRDVFKNPGIWGSSYNPNNLMTCGDILNITDEIRPSNQFKSGFVSLQTINNIYITSPNLGSFDTIAEFSNNVIKKVPVTAPYGYMIIDQSGTNNDFLNCSKQVLRTIEFHLKDSRGNYIKMHNMNCSFSIVFNKFNLQE